MRILLVEDDEFIGESIKEYFEFSGNRVDYFNSPKNILEIPHLYSYDIFLFDINMGQTTGIELYKELKEFVDIPVIFITAYSDITHIEKAFEIGASDYVKKPFDLKELELRVKKLIFNNTNQIKIDNEYKFNLKNQKLFYKDEEVELSPNEKSFIELLCHNIGQIVDSSTIIDYIWEDKTVCNNTLRTTVKKLRMKLKNNFIKNIRGVGYKIEKL